MVGSSELCIKLYDQVHFKGPSSQRTKEPQKAGSQNVIPNSRLILECHTTIKYHFLFYKIVKHEQRGN